MGIKGEIEIFLAPRGSGKWTFVKNKLKEHIDTLKPDTYTLMTLKDYDDTMKKKESAERSRILAIVDKRIDFIKAKKTVPSAIYDPYPDDIRMSVLEELRKQIEV